jgi:hypothetical protein
MEETWTRRDFPVLRALVEHFDAPDAVRMDLEEIEAATGLSDDAVKRALRALDEAEPPYIRGIRVGQTTYPVVVTGVTERARRQTSQWPTPEKLVDRLVTALSAAADDEPDPERQGKLRSTAMLLGGTLRDVAVQVAGTAITRGIGM